MSPRADTGQQVLHALRPSHPPATAVHIRCATPHGPSPSSTCSSPPDPPNCVHAGLLSRAESIKEPSGPFLSKCAISAAPETRSKLAPAPTADFQMQAPSSLHMPNARHHGHAILSGQAGCVRGLPWLFKSTPASGGVTSTPTRLRDRLGWRAASLEKAEPQEEPAGNIGTPRDTS